MASFWSDEWLDGFATRVLAPLCFALARRKNLTVKEALTEERWMRGLQRMNNEEQLDQFVDLWVRLQDVFLTGDTIAWKFSANGQYSTK